MRLIWQGVSDFVRMARTGRFLLIFRSMRIMGEKFGGFGFIKDNKKINAQRAQEIYAKGAENNILCALCANLCDLCG